MSSVILEMESEPRAGIDNALILAVELDASEGDEAIDGRLLADLSMLPRAGLDGALVAAIWLRAGILLPRNVFLSAWSTQENEARRRLATAMLKLQPVMAVRVLGVARLADLLGECRESEFHRLVAQALTLCRLEGAEACLTAMLPTGQGILAPDLAESVVTISSQGVPEWIDRLPYEIRQSALARFAAGTLRAGSQDAFAATFQRLEESGRSELVMLLERGLRGVPASGVLMLANIFDRLPKSDPLAIALASALILNAADYPAQPEIFDRFAACLSKHARRSLASRPQFHPENLSAAQRAVRCILFVDHEIDLSPRQASDRSGKASRDKIDIESQIVAQIMAPRNPECHSLGDWRGFERRIATVEDPAKRAQMLVAIAPRIPPARLAAFGALSAELPPSAWQRQVKMALFVRALASGIDPWSVVQAVDRRDAIAALIEQRLNRGRFDCLEHRAWLRLVDSQKMALLRVAFDCLAEQSDQAVRRASIDMLCETIVILPMALSVISAIHLVRRFSKDMAMLPNHLWRLAEIGDTGSHHREELLRTCAMAFWLRGDQQAGAHCHARAQGCSRRTAQVAAQGFLAQVTTLPEPAAGAGRLRQSAAALAMFEADDAALPKQVAECLSGLVEEDRNQLIAHLIVQGQASNVLLAQEELGDGGR